jgi:hypothetical protein
MAKWDTPERTQKRRRKLMKNNCFFSRETASVSLCTMCSILHRVPINVRVDSHWAIGAQHIENVERVEGERDGEQGVP